MTPWPNSASIHRYALQLSCLRWLVESEELLYVRELVAVKHLDKYDTGKLAEKLGNTPADDDDGRNMRSRVHSGHRVNQLPQVWCNLNLDLVNRPEEAAGTTGQCVAVRWLVLDT